MATEYLSPAFAKRTREEIGFVRSVDGATGFSLFWIDIVKPLLCKVKAERLLEIGADQGDQTRHLLQYCEAVRGSLIVIEPFPTPALREIVGASRRVRLVVDKSHRALPGIDTPVDAVLLEGDLNYYAVHGDLVGIERLSRSTNRPLPLIFVRTGWPYARRDMYYDPDDMPPEGKHGYHTSGITPWSADLEAVMINSPFANAVHEGGKRNGILTAVEDFVRESSYPLGLFSLPLNHGLGIVYTRGSAAESFIEDNFVPPPGLNRLLETVELARLNDIIGRLRAKRDRSSGRSGIRRLIDRGLGRAFLGIIRRS